MTGRKPFSLVRRMIVLVVGVSFVALVVHSAILVIVLKPLVDELAERLAMQISTVAKALALVPPRERDSIAANLSTDSMMISRDASNAAPSVEGTREPSMLPPPMAQALSHALGHDVRITTIRTPAGASRLNFELPIQGEPWTISLPSPTPSIIRTLLPLLTLVGLVAAAAGLALVIGVRLVTRPMSQLAADMLSRRQQLSPIAEPEGVSLELQGVIRSFNELVHAVELSAQARRDLLAGVSHDLRTPLARLRLRVEVEGEENMAQRMEGDFVALARIIDQFLAFAQGQNGAGIGRPLPLTDLVDEVVAKYQADGVDVTGACRQHPALIVPGLGMQRVLTNLIENGLSYGQPPIEVETSSVGGEVLLIVFDRGVGIAEEELEQALKPFVRLNRSDTSAGHCGLGLAIVSQVAEQLGGRVLLKPFDGTRSGVGIALSAS